MPIHDWTRVEAGIFHHFHLEWIAAIANAVNRELKGTEYYALAEQIAGGLGPDVLTLKLPRSGKQAKNAATPAVHGGVALADAPPKVRYHITEPAKWYAAKKKAVTIRHISGHRVVAVLEIVSPGNKAGHGALDDFVRKAQELLRAGVHLTFVDVLPPTKRDQEGLHPLIWDADDDTFRFDAGKPLTCASYIAAPLPQAFVEPVAVGEPLPTMPLFLTPYEYLPVPLEATYQTAFEGVPDFSVRGAGAKAKAGETVNALLAKPIAASRS